MLQTEYELRVAQSQDTDTVREDEWQAKYDSLKAVLPQFKARKKEEAELTSEIAVLNHTIAELRTEEQLVMEDINKKEGKIGAAGFVQTAMMLDKV